MIRKRFEEARAQGKKLFIAYITAGDPSLAATARFALALEKAGVDVLEIGVPHSDPVADGSVLVRAADRALKGGVKWEGLFTLVKTLRERGLKIPVLYFTYWNPVAKLGAREFCKRAREAGADGALIVDLPPEEASDYLVAARASGLETVFLASPTTDSGRLGKVISSTTGFVYVLARAGVTGERKDLDPELAKRMEGLRKACGSLPLAVGFGISTPEQARAVAGLADGVVVGSALVRVIEESKDEDDAEAGLAKLARALAGAIHP